MVRVGSKELGPSAPNELFVKLHALLTFLPFSPTAYPKQTTCLFLLTWQIVACRDFPGNSFNFSLGLVTEGAAGVDAGCPKAVLQRGLSGCQAPQILLQLPRSSETALRAPKAEANTVCHVPSHPEMAAMRTDFRVGPCWVSWPPGPTRVGQRPRLSTITSPGDLPHFW